MNKILITQSLDKVVQKLAYFNPSTWLPGRPSRDYPVLEYSKNKPKQVIYICSACNVKAYTRNCPYCGNPMRTIAV